MITIVKKYGSKLPYLPTVWTNVQTFVVRLEIIHIYHLKVALKIADFVLFIK